MNDPRPTIRHMLTEAQHVKHAVRYYLEERSCDINELTRKLYWRIGQFRQSVPACGERAGLEAKILHEEAHIVRWMYDMRLAGAYIVTVGLEGDVYEASFDPLDAASHMFRYQMDQFTYPIFFLDPGEELHAGATHITDLEL